MKVLITVGSTNFDNLMLKLMLEPYLAVFQKCGVTDIYIQNGNSKINLSPFKKKFLVKIIKTYTEYLSALFECDFGISHCGIYFYFKCI